VYRVFQKVGTLLYKVKESAANMTTFEVETPYLAAVVTGGVFAVTSNATGGSVHGAAGTVEVQPMLGGEGVTLNVGQTARVASGAGADIVTGAHAKSGARVAHEAPPEDEREGTGNGSNGRGGAESVGANTGSRSQIGPVEVAPAKGGKAVVISKTDISAATFREKYPRAVLIFGHNSGRGIFPDGKTVATAFGGESDTSGGDRDARGEVGGLGNGVGGGVGGGSGRGTGGGSGRGTGGGSGHGTGGGSGHGTGGGLGNGVGGGVAGGLGGGVGSGWGYGVGGGLGPGHDKQDNKKDKKK
jgi:hypothetical protein